MMDKHVAYSAYHFHFDLHRC